MLVNKSVVQIANFIPSQNRSFEQFLLNSAEALTRNGWKAIFVFAGDPSLKFKDYMRQMRVDYFITDFPLSFIGGIKLGLTLRQYNPKIIITHYISKFDPCIFLIKYAAGSKIINVDHSSGRILTHRENSFLRRIAKKIRGKISSIYISRIVAVSNYVKKRNIEEVYFPGRKISVIYNGIDPNRFPVRDTPTDRKFKIGFAGQLIQEKGLMTLLNAVHILKRDGILVSVYIAGVGPMESELKEICNSKDLNQDVQFIGQVDTSLFFSSMNVVVIPSEWDKAFGFVAVEAASCGRAIVVSDAGALPEIVGDDPKIGLIFKRGDARELASKLQCLYMNPSKVSELGRKGRERVLEKFTISGSVGKYIDCIRYVESSW
jgi:glycosyltransferase involved in cell wall biosynthesis